MTKPVRLRLTGFHFVHMKHRDKPIHREGKLSYLEVNF